MSRARCKCHFSDAAPSPPSTRRRGIWLPAGVFVVAITCAAAAGVYRIQFTNGAAASAAAASPKLLPEAERQKLVGRWRRADANYVLEITRVAPDGQVDAAYLNPRPIHVSKAIATSDSGKMNVLVELRDRLYPGSYYTLTYNPSDDRLVGVYHHLGVHQEYDVAFVRAGSSQ